MAQVVKEVSETLLAVAELLRKWIPELEERAIAVTEVDAIKKDVMPTLPIAIVAPLRQDFADRGGRITVTEHFLMEIWLDAEREPLKHGGESPFWKYYRYNDLRDKFFAAFASVRTPQNGEYKFISMDVESNFFATMLTFRMSATYDVCPGDQEWEEPVNITFSLCPPKSPNCQTAQQQEKDPCLAST